MHTTASACEPKAENPYSDQVYPTIRFTQLDPMLLFMFRFGHLVAKEFHNR